VPPPPEVFVSYSRDDSARVLELAGKLRAAGVSLWIDQGGIDAASLWSEQIVTALERVKVLLLIVTESAVQSHNVAKEVMLVSERNGNILPVHLEPTVIPSTLKYPLAGIQHIEYFADGNADAALTAILRSLARIGVTVSAPRPAGTSPGREAAIMPERAASTDAGGAVAVMPFDNMSSDPETDYFSDGLTEELTTRLSLVSEIELVSRWASKQLKERKHDVRAISTELGARYIVGGSVRRFQDSFRINVQLVDVTTNRQIWANTYKGKLDDIFDIQEQVAQQIVEALKLKLNFSEKVSLTKRQTLDANAYDLYLKGQDYLYRQTKRSVEYAIQLFERAIELDARYAGAYAAASIAYGQMYQSFDRTDAHRVRAQELSFKALMYDNNLPEAYTAMGLAYFIWGKFEEAGESSRKAVEMDPDGFVARWILGRIHFTNGEFGEAYKLFKRVTELKPAFFSGYVDLAQSCDGLGKVEEARTARKQVSELMPNYLLQNPDDARGRMYYAVVLAEMNRKEEALREGTKALEISPDDGMMLYNCACLYARLGESGKAIDTLRAAQAKGYADDGWLAHDPDLNGLRDHPDFIALLAQREAPADDATGR
jgi:adenylate cyclase